jgi:hypothetical protein
MLDVWYDYCAEAHYCVPWFQSAEEGGSPVERNRGGRDDVSRGSGSLRAGAASNKAVSHRHAGHAAHREGRCADSGHLPERVRGPQVELYLHRDGSQLHPRHQDR